MSLMEAKKWSLVPSNIKKSEALEIFNQKIRYWKPDAAHVGFVKPTLKDLDIYNDSISIWFCFEETLSTNHKGVFFFPFYHSYFVGVDLC